MLVARLIHNKEVQFGGAFFRDLRKITVQKKSSEKGDYGNSVACDSQTWSTLKYVCKTLKLSDHVDSRVPFGQV